MGNLLVRLPYLQFYSDKTKYAHSKLFTITTNPLYKDNKGLDIHEYEHIKQFYLMWLLSVILFYYYFPLIIILGLLTHNLLYTVSLRYRLWSEVNAYKKQMEVDNNYSLEVCAKSLVEDYGFTHLTLSAATELIEYKNNNS